MRKFGLLQCGNISRLMIEIKIISGKKKKHFDKFVICFGILPTKLFKKPNSTSWNLILQCICISFSN